MKLLTSSHESPRLMRQSIIKSLEAEREGQLVSGPDLSFLTPPLHKDATTGLKLEKSVWGVEIGTGKDSASF